MNIHTRSFYTTALGAMLLVSALSACNRKEQESTVGQKVDKVIGDVSDKTHEAKEDMQEKVKDAKIATTTAAENAAAAVTDAAITTGVKAKQLASDVQGVVDVDNLLQIKSK